MRPTVSPQTLQGQYCSGSTTPLHAEMVRLANAGFTFPVLPTSNTRILPSQQDPWWHAAIQAGSPENGALIYATLANLGHCDDAWTYLSLSANALLNGDTWASVHLAYYAELRAALCSLGCSGIFLRNRQSFIFMQTGQAVPVLDDQRNAGKISTHQMIWPAYQAWANVKGVNELSSALTVNGIELSQIITGLTFASSGTMSEAIRQFGVDLANLKHDHLSRDTSSYNPTILFGYPTSPVSQSAKAISDAWVIFRESEVSERMALNLLYSAFTGSRQGSNTQQDQLEFIRQVSSSIQAQGGTVTMDVGRRWSPMMIGPLTPLSLTPFQLGTPNFEFGVWSRAYIMCLIASLCNRNFLKSSGVPVSHKFVQDWCEHLARTRGLYDPGAIEELSDLWADIELQQDFAVEFDSNPPSNYFATASRPELFGLNRVSNFNVAGLLLAYA